MSSVTVHNEIFYRWPKLVEILFEPFFRDRRGEIPRGLKARCRLAAFHVHEGYFSASVDPTYMEPVRRSRKVPAFTGLQNDAIAKIQALSKELRFDTGFKRTDMHFCNNHVIFPARQAYKDHSSKKKWHLLHIWLKARDGRPLPADFYERHGEMNKIDCAGDIVAENTMLKVPI